MLVLSRLIPHLGLDQPVFGFRPRWMEGDGAPYASVEEAAQEFLAELRTVQQKGPYLLGGATRVGGVVALEIARLLMAEGGEGGDASPHRYGASHGLAEAFVPASISCA